MNCTNVRSPPPGSALARLANVRVSAGAGGRARRARPAGQAGRQGSGRGWRTSAAGSPGGTYTTAWGAQRPPHSWPAVGAAPPASAAQLQAVAARLVGAHAKPTRVEEPVAPQSLGKLARVHGHALHLQAHTHRGATGVAFGASCGAAGERRAGSRRAAGRRAGHRRHIRAKSACTHAGRGCRPHDGSPAAAQTSTAAALFRVLFDNRHESLTSQ